MGGTVYHASPKIEITDESSVVLGDQIDKSNGDTALALESIKTKISSKEYYDYN